MDFKRRLVVVFILAGALIFCSAFALGTYWGYEKRVEADTISILFGEEERVPDGVDFKLLLRAWNLIDEKYPFSDKPTDEERLWGAVAGIIGSIGDPYSSFLPPEQSEIFSEDIAGDFGGVGMEVAVRDEILTVISPIKNSPAYKAGILSGDKVIKINDEVTAGLSLDEAVVKIRGPVGTQVKLTIFREGDDLGEGKTIDITVTRDKIRIPTIDTKLKDDVYIISLYNFNGSSTELFKKAIDAFTTSQVDKLIIDLRGNPGGFLDAAIDMASLFVPQGKIIVSEDMGEKVDATEHRSKGFNLIKKPVKVIVLVDRGSASASEIFAAALQDYDLAEILGEKTFGKGSVQELIPFTNNTFVKMTIAKWLTPKGHSIDKNGVTPDIEVDLSQEDLKKGIDTQLEEAIRILKEK